MTSESLREQHESLGRAVTKLISEQAAKLDSAPVTSPATPAELRTLFDEPLPLNGMPAEDILAQFARDVAPHAMRLPSPLYFGQSNRTPLALVVSADALSSPPTQSAGARRCVRPSIKTQALGETGQPQRLWRTARSDGYASYLVMGRALLASWPAAVRKRTCLL